MFAPKVAKPTTKAASKPAPVRHRLGHDMVEQTLLLQRTMGNQATLRALAQRALSLTGNELRDNFNRDVAAEDTIAREPSRRASWDFSKIPVFPANRPNQLQAPSLVAGPPMPAAMQAKLAVGEVNGPFEHEADRVAQRVMQMPVPDVGQTSAPPRISRRYAGCEVGEQQKRSPSGPQAAVAAVPASVHEALRSPGRPLDAATLTYFEPRFGHDFSQVRVHDDASAAASARDVNAIAYTVGHDIVFAAGHFAPATPVGRRLLAHELTHTVQQSSAGIQSSAITGVGHSSHAAWRDAKSAPVALQRKADPKACLAQKDEILPPIGAIATIDQELTLNDTLGTEYDPLKKQILANTEARQFVCDAGVPAILALWDKRTAAGELNVTAARMALAADKPHVYSKNLDTSWLRRMRLGRAEAELSDVAALVGSQARTPPGLPPLLLPRLPAPQKENVAGAAMELDALIPVFEAATKEFTDAVQTASQLRNQLDHARAEAIKARNPDYAGGPREALAEAVKTASKLQQELEAVHRGTDIGDLMKTSQEVAAAVAKLPPTSDSATISSVLEVVKTYRKNVADRSTQVTDLAGAAKRVSFVLRYFAALNTPAFANPPRKDQMQSMRGHIDALNPDLELLFGHEAAMSLDLFDELGKRINLQLDQRSAMETALGHETALVPPQADTLSFFQSLAKRNNDEVAHAYTSYAQSFFEHRIVVLPEDFTVTALDEIFARPLSLGGLRPLVCTGYAVLGAALLGVAGANTQEFIVAFRASPEQLRTGQLGEGHAVAVITRNGATLFVSNDLVVHNENDAIGPDAVAWDHKEFPVIKGRGRTMQAAIAALQAELARRRSQLP
jgi:hypothetical protein